MNFSFLIIKLKLKLNNNLRKYNILNLHNDAINKRRFLKISFKEKVINLINYKVEKKNYNDLITGKKKLLNTLKRKKMQKNKKKNILQ